MTMVAASTVLHAMRRIPGGDFAIGSEDFYPEEAPVRRVELDEFWIDERPVMVGQFRRFVKQTGYVTVAERPLDPALYPDADPALLVPGSLVFRPARSPVDLSDFRNWWSYVPGATGGAGERHLHARAPPGHAGRLRGRRGVRGLGGQGVADRG
jgi:formylglycine-generating enzyme required for sulfatase activity